MKRLFDEIMDLVFIFDDGSELLCQTTLCPNILKKYGYENVDSFVDLLSGTEIPSYMFDYQFVLKPKGTHVLGNLDAIFQSGGKVSWKRIM